MAQTFKYPKSNIDVTIAGVASEATLQDINTNLEAVLEETTKAIVGTPFYQAINSLDNNFLTMLTVGAKRVEKISVKQNDGNTLQIAVNGDASNSVICPPSGEVQFFDLVAETGDTIDIKIVGAISNAGPVEVNFFG